MALTKIQLSQMLSVYGKLLTETQREILTMYCDCDCTLTEISAEKNITRQGVRDAILKAEAAFERLEECLHLAEFVKDVSVAVQSGESGKVAELAQKFVEKE